MITTNEAKGYYEELRRVEAFIKPYKYLNTKDAVSLITAARAWLADCVDGLIHRDKLQTKLTRIRDLCRTIEETESKSLLPKDPYSLGLAIMIREIIDADVS